MPGNGQDIRSPRYPYRYGVLLALLASLPFLGLLKGQYLYDDFSVILLNQNLVKVHTFSDCFSFVLKPSKPVTNFFIALGHWIAAGKIIGHRAISIGVHICATLFLFANLRLLIRRLKLTVPSALPFWISLVFSLHPISSEPLAIVLFRMDMLGAMFSLVALWSLQRLLDEEMTWGHRAWLLGLLFISLGMAQLSKEVFAAVLPITLIAFASVTPNSGWKRRIIPTVFGMEIVWALILVSMLRLDARSQYPYHDVIGFGVQSPATQIPLAARALVEGMGKVLTGHGLSILPVRLREGSIADPGLLAAIAILACGLFTIFLLWRAGGWWRAWGTAAGSGIFVYLLIPNLNIGSEHYWYFPTMGLLSLGGLALWTFFEQTVQVPILWMWMTVLFYGAALTLGLETRLKVMQSRIGLYLAESDAHPESAAALSYVVMTLLEKPGADSNRLALPFLEQAKKLAPDDANVLSADFSYLLSKRDRMGAEKSLRRIESLFPGRPETLAEFEFHLGLLSESLGDCRAAATEYARAEKMDPGRGKFRAPLERARGPGCR